MHALSIAFLNIPASVTITTAVGSNGFSVTRIGESCLPNLNRGESRTPESVLNPIINQNILYHEIYHIPESFLLSGD